jgi:hypothetical protein
MRILNQTVGHNGHRGLFNQFAIGKWTADIAHHYEVGLGETLRAREMCPAIDH